METRSKFPGGSKPLKKTAIGAAKMQSGQQIHKLGLRSLNVIT